MPEAADPREQAFIRLQDHETPSRPTEGTRRRLLGQLRALLGADEAKPFMDDDRLQKATQQRLDDVVAPPACGPLLAKPDRTAAQWLGEAPHPAGLPIEVVVLPPCEDAVLLRTWAQQTGHAVLPAPERDLLVTSAVIDVCGLENGNAQFDDARLLVVPRLEDWLLRHRNGLDATRRLLTALVALRRPVVLGCNRWAWALLGKAAGAHLLPPEPITFQAFDPARLHRRFAELAHHEATGAARFRLPTIGQDVLAQDADGKLSSNDLEKLAGRSLGIPLGGLAPVATRHAVGKTRRRRRCDRRAGAKQTTTMATRRPGRPERPSRAGEVERRSGSRRSTNVVDRRTRRLPAAGCRLVTSRWRC